VQTTISKGAMSSRLHRTLLTIVTVTKDNYSDLCSTIQSMSQAGFLGQHLVMDASNSLMNQRGLPKHEWDLEVIASNDRGPFDGMNRSLGLVTGKYVLFLNAGDRLMPHLDLDFLIWKLEDNENCRWLVARSMSVQGSEWVGAWPHPSFSKLWRSLGVQSWNHQSTIYETTFLVENGGFVGSQITADWSTALNLEGLSPPLLHGGYIALFDISGVSSRLDGLAWVTDHVNSWRSIGNSQGAFDWLRFLIGYLLLKLVKYRGLAFLNPRKIFLFVSMSVVSLARRCFNLMIRSRLLRQLFICLRNSPLAKRSLILLARGIGLSKGVDRILEKAQLGFAENHSFVANPGNSSLTSFVRHVGLKETPGITCSLFVDDVISDLAPNRGIEKFWMNTLKELQKEQRIKVVILSATGRLDTLGDEVIQIPIETIRQSKVTRGLLDQYISAEIAGTKNIFISTYYNTSKAFLNLTVVHDLIPEIFNFPKTGVWARRIQSFEDSELLIALSDNTSQDFLKFYPGQKNKLHSISMGVDSEIFKPRNPSLVNQVKESFGIPMSSYLLYVGAREFYKAGAELINLAKTSSWDENIVFVGGEFLTPEGNIYQVFPDELELSALFSGADATIITSNYEGFGMPALESSACGTPVISKNNSSLFEATLGRGIFVDKFEVSEVSQALLDARSFKNNQTMVSQLVSDSSKRSWSRTAREMLHLIERHINAE
jgi:glycosyltransferase involved in cell wall biosynthesis